MSAPRQHPLANVDWLTVIVYGIFVIFGWMNIYSAAVVDANPSPFDISQEYGKQFLFIAISGFLAFLVLYMEGEFFNKFAGEESFTARDDLSEFDVGGSESFYCFTQTQ